MGFKGTKGEWEITDNLKIISSNKIIADCSWVGREDDANALLISKAPEMLEMLKSVYELQKNNYGYATDTHIAMITKAKEIEQLIKEATEL